MDCIIIIVTQLQAGRSGVRILEGAGDNLQHIETFSRAHPGCY